MGCFHIFWLASRSIAGVSLQTRRHSLYRSYLADVDAAQVLLGNRHGGAGRQRPGQPPGIDADCRQAMCRFVHAATAPAVALHRRGVDLAEVE